MKEIHNKVNKERMVAEFLQLVSIDSVTRHERQMADALTKILQGMGLEVYEDDAGEKIKGNAGNLICNVRGTKDVPAVLLMAHMDTVVPGIGKKSIVCGDIIKSDGTTVLGGDDVAGIVSILESLRVLKENKAKHGDIQVVFTIAEEGGLNGSKNLDYSRINARYGFVLDSGGPVGSAAIKAPSQNKISAVLKGRAAHAGIEPEKGVDAIKIFAQAVSGMKLGRIDYETTANIGVVSAGHATNIVCDRVEIYAEARSRNAEKLEAQTSHMKECFSQAAILFGGELEWESEQEYPAYSINCDAKIIKMLEKASAASGIELKLEETGGGSDTNIINGKGIESVDMGIGMCKVHSTSEQLAISDLVNSAVFLVAILLNIE